MTKRQLLEWIKDCPDDAEVLIDMNHETKKSTCVSVVSKKTKMSEQYINYIVISCVEID